MTRMLMLSAAMVLGLSAAGTASAGAKILDCYGPNGKVVTCAAGYGNDLAARRFYKAAQRVSTRSTAPGKEEIQVTGVRPDVEEIPTYTQPIGPSRRPGLGGDWTPVVATSPIDRLEQWRQTYLTGDGLLSKLNF